MIRFRFTVHWVHCHSLHFVAPELCIQSVLVMHDQLALCPSASPMLRMRVSLSLCASSMPFMIMACCDMPSWRYCANSSRVGVQSKLLSEKMWKCRCRGPIQVLPWTAAVDPLDSNRDPWIWCLKLFGFLDFKWIGWSNPSWYLQTAPSSHYAQAVVTWYAYEDCTRLLPQQIL